MSLGKSILFWVLAVVIAVSVLVYQRTTGPTYPLSGEITIGETKIEYKLPRTHGGPGDQEIAIYTGNSSISGRIDTMRVSSHDSWRSHDMEKRGDTLVAWIAHQPMAGKVMYKITLSDGMGEEYQLTTEPVIIRFKGAVPGYVTLLHVLLIFAAFILAIRTGFEYLGGGSHLVGMTWLTVFALLVGGMILGPLMQKYAFDAWWTGWPLGQDLTDNKFLVSLIFWIIALVKVKKDPKWVLIALIVLIAVFLIPHSLLGSEFDYTKVEQ